MTYFSKTRRFGKELGKKLPGSLTDLSEQVTGYLPFQEKPSPLLKTVSWGAAAMGVLAIGVVVGRELRIRYKFNRRTPYDFYAHSGDEQDVDFGLGV